MAKTDLVARLNRLAAKVLRSEETHDEQCEAEFIDGAYRWTPCECAERVRR